MANDKKKQDETDLSDPAYDEPKDESLEMRPRQPGEERLITEIDDTVDTPSVERVEGAYDADSISKLNFPESVRHRPGMYIGTTDHVGLFHLFKEIIDNSIDEVLAGHCNKILVTLAEDHTVSVEDNGRGIPVGINAQTGQPAVELAMTELHAGGKFGNGGYKTSGGLHGVGASCVNALSDWLETTVKREGKIHRIRFERGVVSEPLHVIGNCRVEDTGTTQRWMADRSIFAAALDEHRELDYRTERFIARVRELAFLNKEVAITFINQLHNEEPITFHFKKGIAEYVAFLNENKDPLHSKVVYFFRQQGDTQVEVALQYNRGYQENIYCFANNIPQPDGGTHLSGLKTALTRVLNSYARKNSILKERDTNLSGDDVREGITAVISVRLTNPQFNSQDKVKLTTPEVEGLVNSAVGDGLTEFLEENPNIARAVLDKAFLAQKARDAARKAAELVKRQSAMEIGNLPGKLADCTERDPRKCEIYLVEGDSAGGSAKQGRDRRTQAILPLFGKVICVEKARIDKALDNESIKMMISALGTGLALSTAVDDNDDNSKFDLSKLRYHKIILMSDADVDGDHIRTLLLNFFYRYMKPLVDHGHIYIAQPPLYAIRVGKDEKRYAKNEAERDAIVKEIKRKEVHITRFKGLGEMNPEDLSDTTMNPEFRVLKRVTVEEAAQADEMFTILMGERVEPRKLFIEKYAKEVKDIDMH